jgi:hypothetical protein
MPPAIWKLNPRAHMISRISMTVHSISHRYLFEREARRE